MSVLLYKRMFTISASHFSSQNSYDKWWEWLTGRDDFPSSMWAQLLSDIHGHDFQIEVEVIGEVPTATGQDYVVSDEQLDYLIQEWANQNLSVHPDFCEKRIRATTENIARLLVGKVQALSDDISAVEIAVHEGPNIVATCSSIE